jgi:hypothetical protein
MDINFLSTKDFLELIFYLFRIDFSYINISCLKREHYQTKY